MSNAKNKKEDSTTPKRILLIDANPSKFSFTACLAEEYQIGAQKSGFDIQTLILRDMEFDPILHHGYKRMQKLEVDLERAQKLLLWCQHLVLFSPVWWYSMPALLKGFFDRVMLPDFAFSVEVTPKRKVNHLLAGRTASLFYTYGGPQKNMSRGKEDLFALQLRDGILYFCGFENVATFPFYETIGFKNIKRRQQLIDKVAALGAEGR